MCIVLSSACSFQISLLLLLLLLIAVFLLLELSAKTLRSLLGSFTFLFPTPFLYTVKVTELLT